MQNVPKKPGRPKKVVINDTATEERQDVRVEDATPFTVLSITSDRNGNILGLANDGKIYRYNTILQQWDMYQ